VIRTIISLTEDIKVWLDNYSHAHRQSISETIRKAIIEYKDKRDREQSDGIIQKTSGIWKKRKIDGLAYVNKLREDWD